MNNKHTPGPWTFISNGDEWQIETPENGYPLMGNAAYYPWNSENKADWHLIATAPEMLEMLRTLLQHNQKVADDDSHYCFDDQPVRALISKATGEKS